MDLLKGKKCEKKEEKKWIAIKRNKKLAALNVGFGYQKKKLFKAK